MNMMKLTLAAATLTVGLAASATAMPIQKLGTEAAMPQVDQVRLVCNRWGRCWHVPGWRGAYGYYPGWRHRHWRHRW